MAEPLVSILTPVHNTAAYLAECIESVLQQSYGNWEYVIVDNASTDGSGDIARRYACGDTRIRVVRFDELVPQVPNYNRAIALASPHSAYVKVLEADNWLFPDCISKMVELAQSDSRLGIVSAYNSTETRLRLTGLPLATKVVDGRQTARRHLAGEIYLFGAPSTVLFRADLVRNRVPFYDEECLIAEDLDACFRLLRECDFGFVHQVLTFVRTENDSILSKIKGFDAQALDRIVMFERHGKNFFEPEEHGNVRRRLMQRYYTGLAQGFLRRSGPRFWDFHRRGLASVGLTIDRFTLTLSVTRELVAHAAHPIRSLREFRGSA